MLIIVNKLLILMFYQKLLSSKLGFILDSNILYTTYEPISKSARIHWLQRLARDKHSSLLQPLISYKGHEVL